VGFGVHAALELARVIRGVSKRAGDAAQNEHDRQRTHELGLQRKIRRGVFACLVVGRFVHSCSVHGREKRCLGAPALVFYRNESVFP
jgi:hypothetical protein